MIINRGRAVARKSSPDELGQLSIRTIAEKVAVSKLRWEQLLKSWQISLKNILLLPLPNLYEFRANSSLESK